MSSTTRQGHAGILSDRPVLQHVGQAQYGEQELKQLVSRHEG